MNFREGGKPQYPEKSPQSKAKNNNKPNPHYDTERNVPYPH